MSTYATPIPGSSGYAQANLLAQRAYQNAMSRYQQQRQGTLSRYGFTRGAGGKLQVDPNNEYGNYQQMLRSEAGSNEALQRHQAGSGWDASSGYLGAQADELQHEQGGEQANLGRSLTDELSGIDQGEQSAAFDRDMALYQSQLDAARGAVNDGNFNPGDYTGLDPAYPDGAAKPAAKTGARTASRKKMTAAAHQHAKRQLITKVRKGKKGGR